MLTMPGTDRRCCDGLTRRDTLKAGTLSALGGVSLPQSLSAAFIKNMPVNSADICAAVYRCLKIDAHLNVPDRNNRPVPVAHGGQPIHDILA